MFSGEGKVARLRTRYTGEPKAAAIHFYRRLGLRFGLVPDATDAVQQRLEALLLRALAHPHPAFEEVAAAPGSVWGLEGASPYPDRVTLWPARGQAAALLARWLPTRAPAGELGGIPGLRAAALRARGGDTTLTLVLAGQRAHVELRADPGALHQAAELARGAGLEALWEADAVSRVEREALGALLSDLSVAQAALWSRALRRLALAREAFPAWRARDPLDEELQGPNPSRIAVKPVGPGVNLRGVVAVVSGDGRGGRGCTTVGYLLAAAAAVGGARVGVLAADDPSNLPALLGLDHGDKPLGWRDANLQLPPGHHLKVAVMETDAARAAEQLEDAVTEFDLLVVDIGTTAVHPELAGLAARADGVVVVVPDEVPWYDDEVIDERSSRVQIWSYLNSADQAEFHSRRPGGPDLFVFLDEAFARYVEWRAGQEGLTLPGWDADHNGDGWPGDEDGLHTEAGHDEIDEHADLPEAYTGSQSGDVGDEQDDELLAFDDEDSDADEQWVEPYDPDDSDDVEMFWSLEPVGGSAWATLPPEEEAPYLDSWRTDFLQILSPEGGRRHPDVWPQVLTSWADRSRARNLERVAAGGLTDAERAAAERKMIAVHTERALERWDEDLWQRESRAWLAADLTQRHEVGKAERERMWALHHPRPPRDVAEELRHLVRHAPLGRPVVMAVNRARQEYDQLVLEPVGIALREHGIGALTVIPRHRALEAWPGSDRMEDGALTIGWTLAGAVLDSLAH
ncbi:hypothetical protein [Streptomyces sp. NPDC004658]|uniref:hypothetical protein n=1 Tax=Streptomyces sp. NPDC004658 TaxID=3154672 RepID=UPI0033B6E77D